MDTFFGRVEGELFVRQVLTNDPSRHFALGSVVFCRVDFAKCALVIHTEVISLRLAEVLRHHYSPVAYCLIIRFSDNTLEINVQFDSEEVLVFPFLTQ